MLLVVAVGLFSAAESTSAQVERVRHIEIRTNGIRLSCSAAYSAARADEELRAIDFNRNGVREPGELVAYAEAASAVLLGNQSLAVAGIPATWTAASHDFDFAHGATGFVFHLVAVAPLHIGGSTGHLSGVYRDTSPETLGWIAVEAGQGVALVTSSAPASVQGEPTTVNEASFVFRAWPAD
jgi:hypothetical protein